MQRDMNGINSDCPIPGGVQGQLGQGLDQPGIVEGGFELGIFKIPSNPYHSGIL